ncbi:MAG: PD40 domain-containing protein, partial [Gemmatimonadaceae bacterium]|nr:PD40 domain-containing protein [Gemmatimonadaceae bacterium]
MPIAALLFLAQPQALLAQLVPADRWLTIETEHFRVHFTKALEIEARRGATNAERAYALLSTELRPPRGKVDMVIADNVDYVNGYATPFPSNRIVIFANPPVETPELRNYDDWSMLVITHELMHIFHLDRAGGVWKVGRSIFGRHPVLFPNAFQPAWVVEGLAVYYESRLTGAGRLEGSEYYMLARASAEAGRIPKLGEISRETSRFPGGETVYAYGGMIFDYLSRSRGPKAIGEFIDVTSSSVFPLSLNAKSKRAFGISFENAWRDWSDSLLRKATSPSLPLPAWRQLTTDGRYVSSPRWLSDTALIYTAANGREVPAAYTVSTRGTVQRLGRRNSLGINVPIGEGGLLFSQPDYTDAFHFRNDLYVERNGRQTRLTRGARLSRPDARGDGEIVAMQVVAGSTRIVRVSPDGARITPITVGDADTQWGEPGWSPDGSRIAALRLRRGGFSDVVVLDTLGRVTDVLVSERTVAGSATWSPDGSQIFYTSSRSGVTQIYATPSKAGGLPRRLSSSSTGAFSPEPSPDARQLAVLDFRFGGYYLGVAPLSSGDSAESGNEKLVQSPRENCVGCVVPAASASAPAALSAPRSYSPWQSLVPTYWEPIVVGSTGSGTSYGAATSGNDIVGRHGYYVSAAWNTKYDEADALAAYQYGGLGLPVLN